MAPVIEELEVFLFDLHLSLRPLIGDGVVPRPEFRFLLDPDAYRATEPFTTENFAVHPLRRDLKRNHFWRHYLETWAWSGNLGASEGLWRHQVPFRCRPINRSIDLNLEQFDVSGRARAEVLLWPSGWSTNLNLSLRGEVGLARLRELVGAVTSGPHFVVDGGTVSLSQVFKLVADLVKEDVYARRHGLGVKRKIDRYRLVAITRTHNPLPPYDPNEMSDADRAELVGTLVGREVSIPMLGPMEQGETFFRTALRRGDFGLTALDRRSTVLALTRAAAGGASRRTLHCLASNVRTCALVAEALRFFRAEASRADTAEAPGVDALDAAADETLEQLPGLYTNPFCRALFRNNGGLPDP